MEIAMAVDGASRRSCARIACCTAYARTLGLFMAFSKGSHPHEEGFVQCCAEPEPVVSATS